MADADRRLRRQRQRGMNTLVASAANLTETKLRSAALTETWQEEAWGFYDTCGEFRYGSSWIANACSRAYLVPATIPDQPGDDPVPVEVGPAVDALEGFAGGLAGQAQVLSDMAAGLFVAGACYLVGEPAEDDPEGQGPIETWCIYSTDDLLAAGTSGDEYRVRDETFQGGYRTLPPGALVIRIWRPHKRWRWQADSPARAALPVMRELSMLSLRVNAEGLSRLAGAGILVVPSEASLPPTRDTDGNIVQRDLLEVLVESMTVPIQNPDSAAAVVPVLVRIPGDYADKVTHIRLSTPFDDRIIALRESALKRLAVTLDMPAEILLGLGDVNHWSAWQIEESAVTLNVEPMLDIICHGLTVGFLRPTLEAMGVQNVEQYVVWRDTSELRLRPDRSADALNTYDRYVIGADALRRETGMDDDDAPKPDELLRMVALKIATSNPAEAGALLRAAGIMVPEGAAPTEPQPGPSAAPSPAALPPAPETPATGPPERNGSGPSIAEAVADAGLVAACDALVMRAVERANSRRKTLETRHRQVDLDDLLLNAWDRVEEVAGRHECDPDALCLALDAYTRGLLVYGKAHSYDSLALALGAYVDTGA